MIFIKNSEKHKRFETADRFLETLRHYIKIIMFNSYMQQAIAECLFCIDIYYFCKMQK